MTRSAISSLRKYARIRVFAYSFFPVYTLFFISNTFISNALRLNFCYLKIIHILRQRYHQNTIGHILRNKRKIKCVCIHKIIGLIIMKMKNRSHRYNKNRPKPRYSKCKNCLNTMLLIFIKQHLSNI